MGFVLPGQESFATMVGLILGTEALEVEGKEGPIKAPQRAVSSYRPSPLATGFPTHRGSAGRLGLTP